MKKLIVEVIKNNNITASESLTLSTSDSKEFIEGLVELCNKLGVDIPVWTSFEEKKLNKQGKVTFNILGDNCHLVIRTEQAQGHV